MEEKETDKTILAQKTSHTEKSLNPKTFYIHSVWNEASRKE